MKKHRAKPNSFALLLCVLAAAFSAGNAACQSRKETVKQTEVNQTAPAVIQPETAKQEMLKSTPADTLPLDSPTAAYKAAFTARKQKDIAGLKRVFSRRLLSYFTEIGKAEKKTLEEMLEKLTEEPQAETALSRDEKIYDDEAVLEYLDENGQWQPMNFVRENGEWKMTLPGEQSEDYKKP